jgi:hypothetical protein
MAYALVDIVFPSFSAVGDTKDIRKMGIFTFFARSFE